MPQAATGTPKSTAKRLRATMSQFTVRSMAQKLWKVGSLCSWKWSFSSKIDSTNPAKQKSKATPHGQREGGAASSVIWPRFIEAIPLPQPGSQAQ
jgi:hypothetical protein